MTQFLIIVLAISLLWASFLILTKTFTSVYVFLKKINFYPSLFNRFSFTIFLICIALIGTGWALLKDGAFLKGGLYFTFGVVILGMSAKQPDTKEGKKVWLLTFLGQKTDVIVDKLTLILNWLPGPIIGYVEFKIVKVNRDFPFKKPIRCKDGYAEGEISTSIVPDEKDDKPGALNWKSGGQKLADFDNIGGTASIKNVEDQLDVMLTSWLQHFAAHKSVEWMEIHALELGHTILPAIMGKIGLSDIARNLPASIDDVDIKSACNDIANSDIDDAREFGVDITKFNCLIKASKNVIDKKNKALEEDAEREGEIKNTDTMNMKIALREEFYRKGGEVKLPDGRKIIVQPENPANIPTRAQIRRELITEGLIDDGEVKIIENESGINVANVDTNKGKG